MPSEPWTLSPDRCFHTDSAQREQARALYAEIKDLPILSPHGHVPPALLLGPPWWFHDSVNGIRRYFDQVVETAGF